MFSKKASINICIAITIYTFGPLIVSMLAGLFGACLGCNINEAGTDKCIRLGIPFGNFLNFFGVVGWLSIITLPTGIIPFFISFCVMLYYMAQD